MSKEKSETNLTKSEKILQKDEEILESAEEFMKIEERVEPGYASGIPDFALGEIEADVAQKKAAPPPPDFEDSLRHLEDEAAQTKADLAVTSAEDGAAPRLD